MKKRLMALGLVCALLLSACAGTGAPPPETILDTTSSEQMGEPFVFDPDALVQDGKLMLTGRDDDNQLYAMYYEPSGDALTKRHFGMSFYHGIDTEWLGGDGINENFSLFLTATGEVVGSVKLTTAPSDLATYYNTTDTAAQQEQMAASFFTTDNYHSGLYKNVVEDFGYTLVADAIGSAFEGFNAFYMEFIDPQTNVHSIRFYLCNDEINEKFFSITVQVNLPTEDTASLDLFRRMVLSTHEG